MMDTRTMYFYNRTVNTAKHNPGDDILVVTPNPRHTNEMCANILAAASWNYKRSHHHIELSNGARLIFKRPSDNVDGYRTNWIAFDEYLDLTPEARRELETRAVKRIK